MLRRILSFVCICVLGQSLSGLVAAQERPSNAVRKVTLAKPGVKQKQPMPVPSKQKVTGVVPQKTAVAPVIADTADEECPCEKIALSVDSIIQNIEQNYKTFKPGEYSGSLNKAKRLIDSLDQDCKKKHQLLSLYAQVLQVYRLRKAAKGAVPVAPTISLEQVAVLKKQLEDKELALKVLQESLEKQKGESEQSLRSAEYEKVAAIDSVNFAKNLAVDGAKTIAVAMICSAPSITFAGSSIGTIVAGNQAVGQIMLLPEEKHYQERINEQLFQNTKRTVDYLENSQYEEILAQQRGSAISLRTVLFLMRPTHAQSIDDALTDYRQFKEVGYKENDLSSSLISGYDLDLRNGIEAINECLSAVQLSARHKVQLASLCQFFVDQRNLLQNILTIRSEELSRFRASLADRNLAALYQLEKDLQQEYDQNFKAHKECFQARQYHQQEVIQCQSALGSYNNYNQRMFGYYINLAWDKLTRGYTQEDYRRLYFENHKATVELTKQCFGLETLLAEIETKQKLVHDAIAARMSMLRPQFENPTTSCQQRLLEALDQTIVQQGALHPTKLNLAPDVLNYLQDLGFDVKDFDSFEVNGFQEALIKEGVEIITFCANNRSEDPAIMPYLDLAGAAATGTIQQIQYIKPEAAFDMIEWAHYLKDCYGDFKHRAKSAFWESFNVPAMAKGIAQLLDMIGRFDEHGTLIQIDLLAAKSGNFTPEQQRNMAIMLLEHQEYTKFVANAYVQMWQENFKDGKLRGICRIAGTFTGNLAGSALFGELVQAAAVCRLPYAPALKSLHRILVLEGERLAPIFNNQNLALHPEFACPEEFAPVIKNVDAFIRDELPGATEQQVIETVAPMSESVSKAIEQVIEKVKPLIKEQVCAKGITDTLIEEICCKNSGLAEYVNTAELTEAVEKLVSLKMHITHLKRQFVIEGKIVQMKSGHSYFRVHLGGGDCRTIGTLNEIEEAIIKDMLDRKCLDLVAEGFTEKFKVSFKDIVIEYEPFKGSKSFCSIDYYPLITKGA